MTTTEELMKLKGEVERSRDRKLKAEGALEDAMRSLKEDHGCSTVKSAKTKVKKLDAKVDEIEGEIRKGIEEIKRRYEL